MRIDRVNAYRENVQGSVNEEKQEEASSATVDKMIKDSKEKIDSFTTHFDRMSHEAQDKKDDLHDVINDNVNKIKNNREIFEKMAKDIAEQRQKAAISSTCMKIFKRLMSGDNVAAADVQYLRKHDSNLYTKGISVKARKKNLHKYNRISPFKDKTNNGDIAIQDAGSVEITDINMDSNVESTAETTQTQDGVPTETMDLLI